VDVQRRVAKELGCGFFDLVRFMGGPMSMVQWAAAAPAFGARDHIHFTARGYQRLGEVLHAALLEGYGASDTALSAAPISSGAAGSRRSP
jgi:lysophospholipase L1-like esterase